MSSQPEDAQASLCDEEKFKDYSDIDSDSTHSLIFPRNTPRLFRLIIAVLSAVALLILVISISLTYKTNKNPHPSLKYDQCGTSAQEARARGCVFETTGFTWLPKECHDPDTEEEFLTYIVDNGLKLYRDMNYTEEVSIQEIRMGEGPGFFVRQQYHLTHCLFLLKKLHRALAAGKIVDGQIMPTHHTEHCVGQLLKLHGYRKDDIQLSYTKYPFCGKPGGFDVGWSKGKTVGWTYE